MAPATTVCACYENRSPSVGILLRSTIITISITIVIIFIINTIITISISIAADTS